MASRKRSITSAPLHWFQRLKQRLTGRMACFVWGALFGNAVLVQTISPIDLLVSNPTSLLSQEWRNHLHGAREQLRQLGEGAMDEVTRLFKQRVGQWATTSDASTSTSTSTVTPTATTSTEGTAFAACRDQFPQGRTLQLEQVDADWSARALCSDGFAVLYSGRTKTPLVVAERLNRSRLQQASGLERTDRFYADARVPGAQRAELSDYQGSGYDRGHMAAAANQYSASGMAQSFALTNMVPQDPTNNRKVWAKLEADVRKYAQRAGGDVFVFTGPLYSSDATQLGKNHVWVPSRLFKLVYDASNQRAWAYVLPNRADAQIQAPISYAEFVVQTQWHLLSGLPVVGGVQ